jgi:hypothetical protein
VRRRRKIMIDSAECMDMEWKTTVAEFMLQHFQMGTFIALRHY